MSQHDFNIANQTASAFRADLNNGLAALASLSSGATAPTTTVANMMWYDTTANILKMRSEANDAWISIGYLDQGSGAFRVLDDTQVVNTSGTQTGLIGDQSTATWQAGTSTTQSLVSPANVKAAIDASVTPSVSELVSSGSASSITSLDFVDLDFATYDYQFRFWDLTVDVDLNYLFLNVSDDNLSTSRFIRATSRRDKLGGTTSSLITSSYLCSYSGDSTLDAMTSDSGASACGVVNMRQTVDPSSTRENFSMDFRAFYQGYATSQLFHQYGGGFASLLTPINSFQITVKSGNIEYVSYALYRTVKS